ncbi:hypothetical protein [Actinomarinicola tropica]|uniref:Uncharacterized protein n=1 Tax=Actinomarinicola tropica TaxID=2789776 RepID=A0A5Q2RJ61_9ACTN|nr:hypothetical protein [Actinomarinicola tropica]QGG94426.1 hypothetical protein GH723_04515 [Actinomarinicola tropica]
MHRRLLLLLLSALAVAGLAACSSDDGDDADAATDPAAETAGPESGGSSDEGTQEAAGDDAENPAVFGYEVDGPAGTTAVVVSTLVAQGEEQQPLSATWSITDRPRWQLYSNWIESGGVEIEVTEGGPATVRIIRARYVDPDDPFAGIDELEEIGTIEVAPGSTETISFP